MPVAYNLKKGSDWPTWQWCDFVQAGTVQPGSSCVWDGARYIYWTLQVGSASAASTTQLWRYDTFTNGWQFMATMPANSFSGADIEYDRVRNVLYVILGNATTTIYCFNLNTTAVTINNISCAAWVFTTLAALPILNGASAAIVMPEDVSLATTIDTGVAATGSTTTSIIDSLVGKNASNGFGLAGTYTLGLIGLQVRFTSGTLTGQHRIISAVTPTTLTVAAFGGAPAAGDTFVVELPTGVLTTGSTTSSLPATGETWTVNQYANQDVIMTSGAAIGQRRRIASNTANTLTLAAAVTGNARTGVLANAPATGDTFQIVPSSDFLYYHPGNGSTGLYRLDVVQTTGSAWSANLGPAPAAVGPGSDMWYGGEFAPFSLLMMKGAATSNAAYLFDLGLATFRTMTLLGGTETFTTGNVAILLRNRRKVFIQKEGALRTYVLDLVTGLYDAGPLVPYAPPTAVDGHKATYTKTPDGVEFIYVPRGAGQEFFRIPLEWMGP